MQTKETDIENLLECDCQRCTGRVLYRPSTDYREMIKQEGLTVCTKRKCRKNGCDCT